MKKNLIGAGGGSSEQHTPVESPDSLRSTSFANIIDAVSEGQIVGLVNGNKSIYFDDVPLQNADETYNFKDVTVAFRDGSIGQAYLGMGKGAENTQDIGVALKCFVPVVRSIVNADVDICRIALSVGQFTKTDATNGDVNGASVQHQIEYRSSGGAWQLVKIETITGKTTSGYQREVSFRLDGSAPWDVRVTRMTLDSTTQTLQDASSWTSMTTIIEEKLRYPATALVGLQINAEQFSNIPRRAYDLKGLIVKVPSNYDPLSHTYTGSWNGVFKMAWTDNPAWCLYDLLTNTRYGLGNRIDSSMIDKWQLYTIGKYCDEQVPNGHGGAEPRFTCNLYIQTRQEAYKLIQDMATIFRGITYWASGSIPVAQDSPQPVRYQFNNTNVENGEFDRAGSNIKTRHNVALVTWNDPSDMYRQKIEYIEDAEAIKRMGYVSETEVVAFGCTSQGQARRYGEWLLFTEQYESGIVTFTTGMEGAIPLPNDVIQVSDILRSSERRGGRVITGSTKTNVIIDAPVVIESGKTYSLSAISNDGNYQIKQVNNGAGSHSSLTVLGGFDDDIAENSTWILSNAALQPETFRVIGIEEVEFGKYKISCLSHLPSKFAHIERNKPLEIPPTSNTSGLKPDVKNVVISEEVYSGLNEIPMSRISVSYQPANAVSTTFFVEYRVDNSDWKRTTTTSQFHAEIPMVSDGVTYAIRIVSGSKLLGVWNNSPTEYSYTPSAFAVPNIAGLATSTAWSTGDDVKFKWDADKRLAGFDIEIIAGGSVVRTASIKNNAFTYTAQDMKADGGYWRIVTFKVRGRSTLGRIGTWSQINAENAQIGALQGLLVTSAINQAFFEFAQPTESDFAGVILWVGTEANFTVSNTNKVFTGNSPVITLTKLTDGTPLSAGATYYLRAAGYDTFGQDGLTVSSSVAFTVQSVSQMAKDLDESSLASSLKSRIDLIDGTGTGSVSARIASEATTRQTSDSALSQQINTVQTSLNGNIASVQTLQSSVNGVQSQWSVKTDVNGYVSGLGLMTTLKDGVPTSSFIIRADKFGIGAAGAGTTYPFIVNTLTNTIAMSGTLLVDGTVVASKAVLGDSSNIYPDFDMTDDDFYISSGTFNFVGTASGSLGKRYVTLTEAGKTLYTKWFPVNVSTDYLVDLAAWMSVSGGGTATAGVQFASVGSTGVETVARTQELKSNTAAYGSVSSYASLSIQTSSTERRMRFYLGNSTGSTAAACAGGFKVTRRMDASLIVNGAIKAEHLSVTSLSAVSATLGNVTAGNIQGSSFYTGSFNQNWAWPTDGGGGVHLSGNGLLMGNANLGKYVQITSYGDFYLPGMSVVNGEMSINKLNVINTANLVDNSVTKSSTYRSDANVTVNGWATLASVSISCNASASLNIFSAFDCVAATQNGNDFPINMTTRLIVDGNVILESLCRTTSCAILDTISVGAGVHTIELKAYSTPVFNTNKALTKKIRLVCISTFK